MAYAQRHVVSITVDASGDGTGYSPVVTGLISTVRYVKTDYADTVDFTITLEATGESVLAVTNTTVSTTWAPRQATHSTAGVASLYASGGTAVNDKIAVADDRIKIVVAQGGVSTSGAFHIVLE
jgi:hypothetical protein